MYVYVCIVSLVTDDNYDITNEHLVNDLIAYLN